MKPGTLVRVCKALDYVAAVAVIVVSLFIIWHMRGVAL